MARRNDSAEIEAFSFECYSFSIPITPIVNTLTILLPIAVCSHFRFNNIRSFLFGMVVCRFAEGLSVLGVLDALQEQPSLKDAFVQREEAAQLTAQMVAEMYTCHTWSPSDSSKYRDETRTMAWWGEVLQDMEGNDTEIFDYCRAVF